MIFTIITKLLHILRSPYYFRSLMKGVAAGTEHSGILRQLDCKTVVDIGANKGQFSLAVRRWMPEAHIYAFEPLQKAADIYRNVFHEDNKVTFYQVAIGPEERDSIIHVSKADDSSSLLSITPLQSKLFPGTEEIRTETIEVKRLSDLISKDLLFSPTLLKVDVQGYELNVLKGCGQLLGDFDYVYVECSFIELYDRQALAYEVIDYLHKRNFYLRGVYNLYYENEGEAVQGDFLFEKV